MPAVDPVSSKYYITPNFIDLYSLNYGEDWHHGYNFFLYDNTNNNLYVGFTNFYNYQPILDMNLTNGTLYLGVEINKHSDNTKHFIIFDFFACVDLKASYVNNRGGDHRNEFSYVRMSFNPDVIESNIGLEFEITVYKELCILNQLELKVQNEYSPISLDSTTGSYQGIDLDYQDMHRRIFKFCKDNFDAKYTLFDGLIDPVDPVDPVESCSIFATAIFNIGDQVRIIGTSTLLAIVDISFMMTKYGTYEVAYKITSNTQNSVILEKLLEKV